MASLNSLHMRSLAAQTTGLRVVDDTPVALRIINSAGKAVTHVIVTAATGIELHDADGTETITWVGGATNYTTVGALVDKINSTSNWKAKVLDSLRSQILTATNVIGGTLVANTKDGELGYDVLLDTSTSFTVPIRCTYDRTAGDIITKVGHRVKLVNFEYVLNVGTAAANKVRIYEWDPVAFTETQIWQAASVKSTTTVTAYDFSKAPITAKEGNDLVVLVTDAASLADAATTNYLQVLYTRE